MAYSATASPADDDSRNRSVDTKPVSATAEALPTVGELIARADRNGALKNSANARSLLLQLIKLEGANAANVLDVLVRDVLATGRYREQPEAFREDILDALRRHLRNHKAAPQQPAPASSGATVSLADVLAGTGTALSAEHEDEYTYDAVVQEFEDDITALREVLLRAFVRAVDMDTAFQARASKLIEDIVDALAEPSFGDYVAEHVSSLRASEMEAITEREQRQQAAITSMAEIQRILDEITR